MPLFGILMTIDQNQAASDTSFFAEAIWGVFEKPFELIIYTILAVVAIGIMLKFFHK